VFPGAVQANQQHRCADTVHVAGLNDSASASAQNTALLARRWGMPAESVGQWLTLPMRAWVTANARLLHQAGLSAQQASDLYGRLDDAVRGDIGRLVDAGRMASLDTAYLHWWAQSGLLRADAGRKPAGRGGIAQRSFTGWVTAARRFIAATGGDQRTAALAAAAGLTAAEVAEQRQQGTLDTLVALQEGFGGDLRDPARVGL